MKKPKKNKAKRKAAIKRGYKRTLRFKNSRQKVADKKRQLEDKRKREQKEYQDMMAKFVEARLNGEM